MRIAALVSLLLVCGCKSAYSPDNACVTVVDAECWFAFHCCTEPERAQVSGLLPPFSDLDSCRELARGVDGTCIALTAVDDAVARDRFRSDDGRMRDCLEPLVEAADACDAKAFFDAETAARGESGVCAGFPFFGESLVGKAGRCQEDADCAGGTCVANADTSVVTATGHCAESPAVGEACPNTGSCGRDKFCDFDGGSLVCRALRPVGADCDSAFQCATNLCDTSKSQPVCVEALKDPQTFAICKPSEAIGSRL